MSSQSWAKFICGSPHRLEILQYITETPADTRDITHVTSGSRPSTQRHLNEFVNRGWVRKSNGKYHVTSIGRRVADRSDEFITSLELIKKHSKLLQHLPEFEQPFREEFLTDGQVVAASEFHPHAPAEYFVEQLKQQSTEKIVGICPIRSRLFDQACVDLLNRGVQIEVIVPEVLFNQKRAEPTNLLDTTDRIDGLELYGYAGTLDFGLTITGGTSYVGVYEQGRFIFCMKSKSSRVCEWVQEIYHNYRERARRLTKYELVG